MSAVGIETSDLFYSDLIGRFLNAPDAVPRDWLLQEVTARLAQPDCRFVLLTGEPGAGKTGVMTTLAAANLDWLRYFVRADSIRPLSGVDTVSLLLRIGHQLAHKQPDLFDPTLLEAVVVQKIENVEQGGTATGTKIGDLTVSPFRQTALRVEQNIGTLAGNLVGIEIARANLEPRMLQPSVLAELALFGPAAVLASKRPDQTIVVLIDGLDEAISSREASTILDWLESFPEAPSNVRFVLSSRPHPRLRTLQNVREGTLQTVALESFSTQVRDDTRAFAERLFRETSVLADKQPPGARDAAVSALATAAKGNFAYLTAYSRSLRNAVQSSDSGMLEELLKFEALPEGLLPLYAAFVRRLRRQVELLGRLPVASSTNDEQVPAWEGVGQRILAILSVSFAPVSLDQLAALGGIRAWKDDIRNVFQNFVPLLDHSKAGWQFFHPSLGEFLRDEDSEDLSDIAVDRRQWDARIVQHYRKGADWPDVSWQDVDEYGLLSISRHLARNGGSRAVLPVVCRKLRLTMRDRFHTDLQFRGVVEQARPDLAKESDIGRLLADTMFVEMVLSGLNRHAAQLEPAVYGLLARLGRVDEALARAHVLQPGLRKYRSLEAIVACTQAELRAPLGQRDGVEMLAAAALEVPPIDEGLFGGMDRDRCLRDAAGKMAADDLDRALGLADLIGKSFDDDRDQIIARAIEAAPRRAQELLARMTRGRSNVALDAAEHLPDEARVLATIALADLAQEEVAKQWRILARVFALTKGDSRDIVDRLEREISETARKYPEHDDDERDDGGTPDAEAREKREPGGWRRAAVDVAERIHALAPDAARRILALWEPAVPRFESADALVKAAELWSAWDWPADARRSLEKALAHYRGLGWYGPARDIAKAAVVADAMDRSWGQELADEAIGLLTPVVETASAFERTRLDATLGDTFRVFRRWDRVRAFKVARWMSDRWISGGQWDMGGRGSAIALLALDAADDPGGTCADLLKECMAKECESVRFGRPEAAVTDFGLFSPSHEPPADANDLGRLTNFIAYIANQMNYWRSGREWRYFDDPAEVLRSMDYPFRSCASWSRSLAAAVAPLAKIDIDRAVAVASWLGDPAERMIALAALAAELLERDHLHANAMLAALLAANGNLPVYNPQIDLEKTGSGDVLLYLNPSIRARFESAAHLLRVGSDVRFELIQNTSPYIQGIIAAQSVFEQLCAMAAEDDASQFDALAEKIGQWDDLLGDLVKFASVAALGRQDAAAAREKAAHIGNETLRTRALLHCVDGAGIAAQCVSILDGAKAESIARHGGELAAAGIQICTAAGKSSRPILERSLAALANAGEVSPYGLTALADAAEDGGRSDLLARAIRAADGIGNGYLQTDALVRIFSSAVTAKDGALVAQIASTLMRRDWRSIMEGLARAMPRLIEAAGPATVEDLDAAMRRAQAVLDTEPGQEGPPAHLDGVIAPHLRPTDPQAALYQAPQLAPEFLASFLDKADISPSITRSRDSRDKGMEPDDPLFEQLHGRHAGFSFWIDVHDKTIGQLFDIRFYFDTAECARDYLRQKLPFLNEGDPEVEDAVRVGEDCFAFGGEFDRTMQGHTIRMTNYSYIFRVDRFVVKLYAAQGVFASEKLTAAHVFQLAEVAKRKIERILPISA